MRIVISNRSDAPIYEQIKEQIKGEIFLGELKEGDMLPSIRQLARDLKVSVITTTRAYNDLEAEGFVASVQGKGSFVLGQDHALVRESALRSIEENLSIAITSAKMARVPKSEMQEMLDILAREENYE